MNRRPSMLFVPSNIWFSLQRSRRLSYAPFFQARHVHYCRLFFSRKYFSKAKRQQKRKYSIVSHHDLESDEYYMRQALSLADEAYADAEVPIGAVLVNKEGKIIGRGRNSVESDQDCTSHAEMNCLRQVMKDQSSWRLLDTTLFCTVEPCPMCLGALALARVSRIIYAAPDLRLGACGSWVDLVSPPHPFHNFQEVRGGVLSDEAAEKMRSFFRKRRLEPSKKPKLDADTKSQSP